MPNVVRRLKKKLSVAPLVFCCLVMQHAAALWAAQVTLSWNPVPGEDITGYRIYAAWGENALYEPIWEGTDTTCTLYDLEGDVAYCFVARAYGAHDLESADSNRVEWRYDECDYRQYAPRAPWPVSPPDQSEHVALRPALVTEAFADDDPSGVHSETHWQVVADREPGLPVVFEAVDAVRLTRIQLPENLLSPDTSYAWRACHIDQCGNSSQWSAYMSFRTIASLPADGESAGGDELSDLSPEIPPADTAAPDAEVPTDNAFPDEVENTAPLPLPENTPGIADPPLPPTKAPVLTSEPHEDAAATTEPDTAVTTTPAGQSTTDAPAEAAPDAATSSGGGCFIGVGLCS